MLLTIVVTLCLSGTCIEKIITDQATPQQCGVAAMQAIPTWMRENGYLDRGYTLDSWSCGGKRTRV